MTQYVKVFSTKIHHPPPEVCHRHFYQEEPDDLPSKFGKDGDNIMPDNLQEFMEVDTLNEVFELVPFSKKNDFFFWRHKTVPTNAIILVFKADKDDIYNQKNRHYNIHTVGTWDNTQMVCVAHGPGQDPAKIIKFEVNYLAERLNASAHFLPHPI